jgi:DNA (cytosine-5)-methyltransferase 1
LSPREGARIQSFPDWFQFYGNKDEVTKQIGNAVPPLLALRIASKIEDLLG